MPRKITSSCGKFIEVTEELIDQAQRAASGHCMIADAIKAALPDAKNVSVDLQTIRFTNRDNGQRYIYFTPVLCQQQLLRFDQGTQVLPWSFRLPKSPAQVVKVVSSPGRDNLAGRPLTKGPRKIAGNGGVGRDGVVTGAPTVRDGYAPPLAVLSNARGRQRAFGVRAAKGFDPSRPG